MKFFEVFAAKYIAGRDTCTYVRTCYKVNNLSRVLPPCWIIIHSSNGHLIRGVCVCVCCCDSHYFWSRWNTSPTSPAPHYQPHNTSPTLPAPHHQPHLYTRSYIPNIGNYTPGKIVDHMLFSLSFNWKNEPIVNKFLRIILKFTRGMAPFNIVWIALLSYYNISHILMLDIWTI